MDTRGTMAFDDDRISAGRTADQASAAVHVIVNPAAGGAVANPDLREAIETREPRPARFRGREVSVRSRVPRAWELDGETRPATASLRFRVLPAALRVHGPREVPSTT